MMVEKETLILDQEHLYPWHPGGNSGHNFPSAIGVADVSHNPTRQPQPAQVSADEAVLYGRQPAKWLCGFRSLDGGLLTADFPLDLYWFFGMIQTKYGHL